MHGRDKRDVHALRDEFTADSMRHKAPSRLLFNVNFIRAARAHVASLIPRWRRKLPPVRSRCKRCGTHETSPICREQIKNACRVNMLARDSNAMNRSAALTRAKSRSRNLTSWYFRSCTKISSRVRARYYWRSYNGRSDFVCMRILYKLLFALRNVCRKNIPRKEKN